MKNNINKPDRRVALGAGLAMVALPGAALQGLCNMNTAGCLTNEQNGGQENENESTNEANNMQLYYLEIVAKDVEATCKLYSSVHGIKFGDADQGLGNARTAKMAGGGLLGVRAPMRASEDPVLRPYFLVDDIGAAVKKAADAGAEIALPKMKIPGHGYCAIFVLNGNELGLWQKES